MNDYNTLSTTVWIIFFGVCMAAFYAYYHRRLLGDLLRAFIAAGADCEKNAKTLNEIGYGDGIKKVFARFALKNGSVLRKTICAVYNEQPEHKKNPDELFVRTKKPDTEQKYFVDEEKRIVAEIRYDGKGTTSSTLLLAVAAFFVIAVIAVSVLPRILQNAGSIFGTQTEEPENTEQQTEIDYSIE